MKKLLYLLIALPLMLASCQNDDDYPEVKVGVDYTGATTVDEQLYVIKGDTLSIDSVFVTPVDPSKPALISSVTYVLNGVPLGIAPTSPFKLQILTAPLETGKYTLRLQMGVYQNDKTPGIAYVSLPIRVVDSASDIPGGNGSSTGRIYNSPTVGEK